MANTEIEIPEEDQIATRTLLHEAIPITGTIVSGTYSDNNIKNYSHGMFQSVYDYPYLSSSANHIFDITFGYANSSGLSSSANSQNSKKINIYNQMAQVLYGYDNTGSIKLFDADGDLIGTTNDKMKECIFITFSRLLMKDEIRKGTFRLDLGVSASYSQGANPGTFYHRLKLTDTGADTQYKINSPVGEYGILIADTVASASSTSSPSNLLTADLGTLGEGQKVGLIFYQAGVAVITASVFNAATDGGILLDTVGSSVMSGTATINHLLKSASISSSANALRTRMYDLSFNNTVELNSTVYFCRIRHNDFNYSSNPTYLSASSIRVKSQPTDTPVAYITSIGLYDDDNNLLAVGKLSEPLRKDPTIEYTLRARLDY
tara:strand:- start:4021 stop:5151 length:1131 start_codon:yes stop_codon:yes gene_type:complete